MKVMVIAKATKASEAGEMDPEMFAVMDKFNEELINAGIMLDGTGLTPTSRGARVQDLRLHQSHRHHRAIRRDDGNHRRVHDLESLFTPGSDRLGEEVPDHVDRRLRQSKFVRLWNRRTLPAS